MTIPEEKTVERELPRYFTAPFSAQDGEYGAGVWYGEFFEGIPRRQFEVYSERTLVAPYDIRFADQYHAVLTDPHYREILLAEFEAAWQEYASKRLRQIASEAPA